MMSTIAVGAAVIAAMAAAAFAAIRDRRAGRGCCGCCKSDGKECGCAGRGESGRMCIIRCDGCGCGRKETDAADPETTAADENA